MKLRVRSKSKSNLVLSTRPTLFDYALYLGIPAAFLLFAIAVGEAELFIVIFLVGITMFNGYGLYRAHQNASIFIMDAKRNALLLILPTEEINLPLEVVQGTYIEHQTVRTNLLRTEMRCKLSLRINYNLQPITAGFQLSADEAAHISDLINNLIKPFKPQQERFENFKLTVAKILQESPPPDKPEKPSSD